MRDANEENDAVDVGSLLAGATRTIESVRYCWLVTAAEDGFANLRPMGRLMRGTGRGEDEWKIEFITDGRSRKSTDLRRDGRVAIIYQHDPDDAFVTLIGKATLLESEAEVRDRWKRAYDALVPTQEDRANAVFVEVDVERMELWIRGVTPAPFGFRTTILERDAGRAWRAVQ